MFLSDRDILDQISQKRISITPFEKKHIQPVGYDLRLHKNFRLFQPEKSVTHIDVATEFEVSTKVDVGYGGSIVIHPGEFMLGATHEAISLPNDLAGLIEGRSSLGRVGLIIHATAGLVNPGFSGHITFEMSNISNLPIKLYVGMRVAQIVFVRTSSSVSEVYASAKKKSKYQNQDVPASSQIWKDFD